MTIIPLDIINSTAVKLSLQVVALVYLILKENNIVLQHQWYEQWKQRNSTI
jgi:hypothetical protein